MNQKLTTKNISKIFKDVNKKLDKLEIPPSIVCGMIFTPYGLVKFGKDKWSGSKKAKNWVVKHLGLKKYETKTKK
jgi:hypothetical protein